MPHPPGVPAPGAFANDPGFRLLARTLPDALFAVDAEGTVTYASDRAVDMLGLPPEALVGRLFRDLVHPDDRATLPEPFSALLGGAWDARFLVGDDAVWGNFSLLAPGLPLAEGTVFILVRLLQAEFAPRDRTTLYREALDATNNLVVVTDPQLEDNPIVFVNANFLKATGYERDEIVGRNCRFLQFRPDGTRDDDQPGFNGLPGLAALREAIETGTDARVVLRNYRKSGEVFYNELYLTAIRDAHGKTVAFIGVQNDITEEVEAKSQLADQETLLRAFYDGASLGMGIVALDGDGTVVHRSANPAALALYHTTEIDGATPEALGFPPEEAALWRDRFRECCAQGDTVIFETQYPWGQASGEAGTRQIRVIVSPMGGTAECTCAYVLEDRTALVAVEQERRRLYAAVESLPDPVLITDAVLDQPGPRIVYVNPAFTRVFGYTPEEVIGETPRMFQGPATDATVLARLRSRLELGEPFRGEAVNYRKDGTPFLMEWEIAPIDDDQGELVHYV
ncbi:MAG: PAS domain-containing protein, partial [Bacteroidota bacterium]